MSRASICSTALVCGRCRCRRRRQLGRKAQVLLRGVQQHVLNSTAQPIKTFCAGYPAGYPPQGYPPQQAAPPPGAWGYSPAPPPGAAYPPPGAAYPPQGYPPQQGAYYGQPPPQQQGYYPAQQGLPARPPGAAKPPGFDAYDAEAAQAAAAAAAFMEHKVRAGFIRKVRGGRGQVVVALCSSSVLACAMVSSPAPTMCRACWSC